MRVQNYAQLKHYSGAMFYYEGEWYWGIGRLIPRGAPGEPWRFQGA